MARIFPFAGYRYNPERVRLDDVLTQPYDKITPEMQERYYRASPYNLIPVEKGRTEPGDAPANNVYTRAAAKLEEWIRDGILVRESTPALYLYAQEFAVPGSAAGGKEVRRERRGLIALVHLEDYSAGVICRHERTLAGPKADRLELLRRTRTQTGQLFMLYSDPERQVEALLDAAARGPAAGEMTDEYGVRHRLWAVSDPGTIAQVAAAMADKRLVIADGHHRYETALAYRDECRAAGAPADGPPASAPHEYAMMTLVNSHSPGLVILPTHRLVANLPEFDFGAFRQRLAAEVDWYAYPFTSDAERGTALEEFRRDLARRGARGTAIGVYGGGGAFYLFLPKRGVDLADLLPEEPPAERRLDVVVLHRLLLERGLGITAEAVVREQHIGYEREMERALAAVDEGRAQLACLLNPVPVERVMEIALGGGVLPQKSTDFYPKMLSGVVTYRLEG